jgi:hypothetical protein
MQTRETFRAWFDQAIHEAPRTDAGIPLIGTELLDLKDAQAAPLIVALADIIEAACVQAAVMPMTHANVA